MNGHSKTNVSERKSALGKREDKVVGNESIYLENIYAGLTEVCSISEDPPSRPNCGTDTSVVQNS